MIHKARALAAKTLSFIRNPWVSASTCLYKTHSEYAIPTQLGLALTHRCNITCPYCMRTKYLPPEGKMTLERVKQLMQRMKPYATGVCIMGLCEPLMNPETPDIIRWLKDEGKYQLSFTTNCTIPFTDDTLDALRRVDDMAVSIDTSDPETFRCLRGGAELEQVMTNLNRLLRYKRERGLNRLDRPPVHVNAVITSMNFHQIPGLIRMFEAYADQLTYLMVDPVTRPDYQDYEEPLMLQRGDFDRHIDEYRQLARKSPLNVIGLDYMLEASWNWRDCHLSWHSIFIEPNGDAYYCYSYDYVLGNVFKENPLAVWNSLRAKQFRRRLLSSEPPLKQCRTCNFARRGWQPGGTYYRTKRDVVG